MNDLIDGTRVEGEVLFEDKNIYDPNVDPVEIRRRIGMVFQKPNPFPKSIFNNIIYGPRLLGVRNKSDLEALVEQSLRQASLWDEVRDILGQSAMMLSGGQQQRLCVARALAMKPDVLLMDEPTSALDPISTAKIEELIEDLKKQYTIIIVTHNMQQAARISDYTGFFYLGELIEYSPAEKLFTTPDVKQTEDYITGRFG
jgi:phosphate transport system ATP-binding protein